jgi:hypothetical protein
MSMASSGAQRYRLGTQTVSRIGFGAMQLPGPGCSVRRVTAMRPSPCCAARPD